MRQLDSGVILSEKGDEVLLTMLPSFGDISLDPGT